jgi:hypothetical protein
MRKTRRKKIQKGNGSNQNIFYKGNTDSYIQTKIGEEPHVIKISYTNRIFDKMTEKELFPPKLKNGTLSYSIDASNHVITYKSCYNGSCNTDIYVLLTIYDSYYNIHNKNAILIDDYMNIINKYNDDTIKQHVKNYIACAKRSVNARCIYKTNKGCISLNYTDDEYKSLCPPYTAPENENGNGIYKAYNKSEKITYYIIPYVFDVSIDDGKPKQGSFLNNASQNTNNNELELLGGKKSRRKRSRAHKINRTRKI